MIPRLFVVPWWVAALAVFFVAVTVGNNIATSQARITAVRALVSCEARAQANLVAATACDSHLTTCLGSVRRIADELELSGVEF